MTNNNDLVDAIIAISELRATNRALLAQLDEARRDLAEARADVQRFEAALDASQRELAEARGQSGKWKRAARIYREELRNAMRDEFAGEFNHLSGPELWEATRLEADQWTGRWSRQRRREHQAGKE